MWRGRGLMSSFAEYYSVFWCYKYNFNFTFYRRKLQREQLIGIISCILLELSYKSNEEIMFSSSVSRFYSFVCIPLVILSLGLHFFWPVHIQSESIDITCFLHISKTWLKIGEPDYQTVNCWTRWQFAAFKPSTYLS